MSQLSSIKETVRPCSPSVELVSNRNNDPLDPSWRSRFTISKTLVIQFSRPGEGINWPLKPTLKTHKTFLEVLPNFFKITCFSEVVFYLIFVLSFKSSLPTLVAHSSSHLWAIFGGQNCMLLPGSFIFTETKTFMTFMTENCPTLQSIGRTGFKPQH